MGIYLNPARCIAPITAPADIMKSSQQFRILVSGSAPSLYPTDTMFAILYYERDEALEVPKRYPYSGEWGEPESTCLLNREFYPVPKLLDMVWLSIVERKFYSLVQPLPVERMTHFFEMRDESEDEQRMEYIIVGMAPYGGVALWLYGYQKSVLIDWFHAEQTNVDMKYFMPNNPDISVDEICNFYINNNPSISENLEKNGLPPEDLFDNYMQQFSYRYLLLFEHWDNDNKEWYKYTYEEAAPVLDYIEDSLFDGTFDKLHDGSLMNYHEAGKPKKLAVSWHIHESEYTAYFWFDDDGIRSVFDQFFSIHSETNTDFILRIDPENSRYNLALICAGLKDPQLIPDDAYQLIVFKNKLECYRSENYNQPRGAWIW